MSNMPRNIDYKFVEGLASIQCTESEIAVAIGFSLSGFSKRKKNDPTLVEAIEKGREAGRKSLRRLQWQTANAGDKTMQIWLGKQYLGQSDKSDIKQSQEIKMYGVDAPIEDV